MTIAKKRERLYLELIIAQAIFICFGFEGTYRTTRQADVEREERKNILLT
jgi:hypothetical protein